jgi:23S rRNA-/tRNA-specific pseudouridylate synthase
MDDAPRIVHRDAHLLVLSKPAFLSTTSPGGGDCLVARAHALDPGAPRLHATSRLDREVTGLVTFARTKRATEALLEARRRGAYRRLYLGLAATSPEPPEGLWTWPIAHHPRDRRLRMAGAGRGEQRAETAYRVAGESVATVLLHLYPHTGRTHQLRVHAAKAGAPLLGDTSYGGAPRVVLADGRVRAAERVMLHCACLELPDPVTGALLRLEAKVPDELARLFVGTGGDPAALAIPSPLERR